MCGIFGVVSLFGEKPDVNSIIDAVNSLSHRGPDDFGLKKMDNVIIGHRRLSIIDLNTKAAKQPVAYKDSLLAYNGMIYNFKDLKNILSINNIFEGNSDTEVLGKCLNQWGIKKTLDKIDGMFAFVWFDRKKKEIYLVRDPMGEKPLYWAKMKNKIYFSSEIKSFFKINEFTKKPNINNIDDYFYTGQISGAKTIYSEINEVEPGNVVKFSTLNGNASFSNYFLLENFFLNKITYKNKIEKLNECMEKSILTRTISDVPFGCLLSGGIDSSLILSYMMKNDDINKVNCYIADVRNKKLSEFKDAQSVISFLKKKYSNKKIKLTSKKNNFFNYINLLKETTKSFDEPIHFSNSLDLLNIVKKASKDGTKVLLSGEGSDELFFGYDRMIRAFKLLKKNASKKTIMQEIYFGGGKHSIDCVKKLCGPKRDGSQSSASWIWLEKNISKYSIEDLILIFSQKFRMQTLLQRQDRVGMLCGLEMRSPFLSKEIVYYANTLKIQDKYIKSSNTTKAILRLMAKEKKLIPNEIIKKKKIGFNTDIDDWLKGNLIRDFLKNLINDKKGFFNGYLDGRSAQEIFDLHFEGKRRLDVLIWKILSLEIWHRVCGEGDNNYPEVK